MSLSINTNTAAMVALESLSATTDALNKTENEVSTGQKVSAASDNPAAYAIAQKMNGNISGLSAVTDGLSFSAQVVSTTSSAVSSILSTLQSLQNAVTSIGSHIGDTASLADIGTTINGYLNQINEVARNATSNGVNLLAVAVTTSPPATTDDAFGVTSTSLTYVTGLQGSLTKMSGYAASGGLLSTAITTKSTSATGTTSLTDILGLSTTTTANGDVADNVFSTKAGVTTATDSASLNTLVTYVTNAINAMTSVSSDLGANTNRITGLNSYSTNLSDSLTSGVGALTDADMAAESSKLTSLQTKQQLAISSLSIAKSSSSNILSLFR